MAKRPKKTEEEIREGAVDLNDVLRAVSFRDFEFYNKLSDTKKKKVSPFVLMSFISNPTSSREVQEYFVEQVNEHVNKHHWTLGNKHDGLLWKLLAMCGIHMSFRYEFLNKQRVSTAPKIVKLILEMYPAMKTEDAELMARLMTEQDKEELFLNLGFDKSQRKTYE